MSARADHRTMPRAAGRVAVLGTATLAGLALGAGGASLALWNDSADVAGEISAGYEHFAAGPLDAAEPAVDGAAGVEVGTDEASALVDDGAIAVTMQTDSVSQGNKGLHYDVVAPDWGEGIFGAAEVEIFAVDEPAACTPEASPPSGGALDSTPVSADYSSSETPVTEYWCLSATLDELPGAGEYANTADVTARDDTGAQATDDDTWHAEVESALDPAEEADHTIEFQYQTFRPGEVTP